METLVADGTYRSREVCTKVGCTFRQLDYWERKRIIRPVQPGRGQGSVRVFSLYQVAQMRVLTVLSSLGATVPVLRAVIAALDRDPGLWSSAVVVGADGTVAPAGGATDGWLVDLPGCWVYATTEASAA